MLEDIFFLELRLKILNKSLYIYKVVISVCLFACLSDLERPTGMFIAWFEDSKLGGTTLIAKI